MNDERLREIWETIRHVVESGDETRKIDLKDSVDFDEKMGGEKARGEKVNFIRHVCAMANTKGGRGYLVIGVLDKGERKGANKPEDYLKHWQVSNIDGFRLQTRSIIRSYIDPEPELEYYELTPYEGLERFIGVFVVEESSRKPHFIKSGLSGPDPLTGEKSKISESQAYIRRGAQSIPAARIDIVEMIRESLSQAHEEDFADQSKQYEEVISRLNATIQENEDLIENLRLDQQEDKDEIARLTLESGEWKKLSRTICTSFYKELDETTRKTRVIELLSRYGKQDLYDIWFKKR